MLPAFTDQRPRRGHLLGVTLLAALLSGCLELGGSWASTASTGSTSAATTATGDPTAATESASTTVVEPEGCGPGEVLRCLLDDLGECGPASACVDAANCDPQSCGEADPDVYGDDCEDLCGVAWDCALSRDPAILRCVFGPEGDNCDVHTQECPAGYKCTLVADDDSNVWSATECVPIPPRPKQQGEPCGYLDGDLHGGDDCDVGLFCDVDPGAELGTCVAYCVSDPQGVLRCAPGTQCAWVYRTIPAGICLFGCDPLAQDCPGDDLCLPLGSGWGCVLDASGDEGQYGDPCEYANACDPGLLCLHPQHVPDCEAGGCCSPLCDTTQVDTCPGDGQVCTPWYEEGRRVPGYENVGVCALPG
ncbi:MAG: hypothetical protein KC486_15120 [Myxococcales bacterium]|nr:hypothetical protein [Myxococcales bacterium]